jgi:hypothetical protein
LSRVRSAPTTSEVDDGQTTFALLTDPDAVRARYPVPMERMGDLP